MAQEIGFNSTTIMPSSRDSSRLEAFLPASHIQNHASNIVCLGNNDLLCTWFSGTQEGMPDISIYLSRLSPGKGRWSDPVQISEDRTHSEQNPVLFPFADGEVWLFWTSQKAGNQDTAIVKRRVSYDNGYSWGQIETFFDTPGTFIRQPPIVLENGDFLFPIFYCVGIPGQRWTGNHDYSAVKISPDKGKSWEEVIVPESEGLVHMNIIDMGHNHLLSFFRSRWADRIYRSTSTNGGHTWEKPIATDLMNNNSSIQACRLSNGHLALVFNNINSDYCMERRISLYDDIEDKCVEQYNIPSDEKRAFWGVPRSPLTIALSLDNGNIWPYMRNLEVGEGYCMTNNSKDNINREYSYPSITQSKDGKLHITYTYFRQRIKYVCIDELWIHGNSNSLSGCS